MNVTTTNGDLFDKSLLHGRKFFLRLPGTSSVDKFM